MWRGVEGRGRDNSEIFYFSPTLAEKMKLPFSIAETPRMFGEEAGFLLRCCPSSRGEIRQLEAALSFFFRN